VDRSCSARNRGNFYHSLVCDWKAWAARGLNVSEDIGNLAFPISGALKAWYKEMCVKDPLTNVT
jgi:hypothetical protein